MLKNCFYSGYDLSSGSYHLVQRKKAKIIDFIKDKDFSLKLSFKTDDVSSSEVILFSNQYYSRDINEGITVSYQNKTITVVMGDGKNKVKHSYDGGAGVYLDDNQWHDVVIVVSRKSNQLKLYIDERLGFTLDISNIGLIDSPHKFVVGQDALASNGSYFDGQIANITFYDIPLSLFEIRNANKFLKREEPKKYRINNMIKNIEFLTANFTAPFKIDQENSRIERVINDSSFDKSILRRTHKVKLEVSKGAKVYIDDKLYDSSMSFRMDETTDKYPGIVFEKKIKVVSKLGNISREYKLRVIFPYMKNFHTEAILEFNGQFKVDHINQTITKTIGYNHRTKYRFVHDANIPSKLKLYVEYNTSDFELKSKMNAGTTTSVSSSGRVIPSLSGIKYAFIDDRYDSANFEDGDYVGRDIITLKRKSDGRKFVYKLELRFKNKDKAISLFKGSEILSLPLDGTSDYASSGHRSEYDGTKYNVLNDVYNDLDFMNEKSFSVSFHIHSKSYDRYYMPLIQKKKILNHSSDTPGWRLTLHGTNLSMSFGDGVSHKSISSNNEINPYDGFYNIVMVVDRENDVVKLYKEKNSSPGNLKDGDEIFSLDIKGMGSFRNREPLEIMGYKPSENVDPSTKRYFKGRLLRLQIFDKKLIPSERASLFH